jgi:superoxide reductase
MAVKRLQVYSCEVCGNIIEVLHAGGGDLVCCDQPMNLLEEKTADQGKEKHVPVIEKKGKGILVKVGSIPHPMEEKHYIEWIEVVSGDKTLIKFLKPGDKPEAEFDIPAEGVTAREYCTVHGFWKS